MSLWKKKPKFTLRADSHLKVELSWALTDTLTPILLLGPTVSLLLPLDPEGVSLFKVPKASPESSSAAEQFVFPPNIRHVCLFAAVVMGHIWFLHLYFHFKLQRSKLSHGWDAKAAAAPWAADCLLHRPKQPFLTPASCLSSGTSAALNKIIRAAFVCPCVPSQHTELLLLGLTPNCSSSNLPVNKHPLSHVGTRRLVFWWPQMIKKFYSQILSRVSRVNISPVCFRKQSLSCLFSFLLETTKFII